MFCAIFTLELMARLLVTKLQFFLGRDRLWNLFDFLLVALQLSEMILSAFHGDDAGISSARDNLVGLRIIKIARILQLLRVVRVFRLVRFVTELRKLTYLIVASFWSFMWTVFLLLMLTYIVAVFFTQVVADQVPPHLTPNSDFPADENSPENL